MTREIKFRGRRTDNGKWVYGGYFFDNLRNVHYIRLPGDADTFMNLCIEVNVETVGQFTGLKDKNGKEIYEGDIVQVGDKELYFIVRYEEESAGFRMYWPPKTGYTKDYDFEFENRRSSWDDLIVTSNIYENPELL